MYDDYVKELEMEGIFEYLSTEGGHTFKQTLSEDNDSSSYGIFKDRIWVCEGCGFILKCNRYKISLADFVTFYRADSVPIYVSNNEEVGLDLIKYRYCGEGIREGEEGLYVKV